MTSSMQKQGTLQKVQGACCKYRKVGSTQPTLCEGAVAPAQSAWLFWLARLAHLHAEKLPISLMMQER